MEPGARVAVVVEDDQDIRELIAHSLTMQGFAVHVAGSGREAIDLVSTTAPDLVTLDLGLPDLDGIEVCRRMRDVSDAYVVMISARTDEIDRLMGLETGADDYLTKPFSPRELQARVTAMFRRPRTAPSSGSGSTASASGSPGGSASATEDSEPGTVRAHHVRHGRLLVDTETRTTFVDDEVVELTRTEFDLLSTLVGAPRRVWPRSLLLELVWGGGWSGEEHLVEVHVGNLRRKLTRAATAGPATFIRTVRGVGYRMEDPDPV